MMMKKITLLIAVIISTISYAQGPWEFTGPSTQNWNDNRL